MDGTMTNDMMTTSITAGAAGSGSRSRIGPIALGLLLAGLATAIAVDGQLPSAWTRLLFGVLLVLDLVAAEWLTRPRSPAHRG